MDWDTFKESFISVFFITLAFMSNLAVLAIATFVNIWAILGLVLTIPFGVAVMDGLECDI